MLWLLLLFLALWLIRMYVSEHLDFLHRLVISGGPNHSDYENLNHTALALMDLSIEDKAKLFDILKPILSINSMFGYSFFKPYGYEGDFELIYKIYTKTISEDLAYQKWDKLFHQADAVKAIRKRKKYFIQQAIQANSKTPSPSVLNLGSGPCVDIFEFFKAYPGNPLTCECVDMDEKSIEFGSIVCDNVIDAITFHNKNVFSFNSDKQFDLIWSAGLFDYFNDKLFISLLKRYYKLLKKGGELVVANFSETNPSRALMEVLCQWRFHHRSEDKLIDLALDAGIPKESIKVKSQIKGINLYLHLSK